MAHNHSHDGGDDDHGHSHGGGFAGFGLNPSSSPPGSFEEFDVALERKKKEKQKCSSGQIMASVILFLMCFSTAFFFYNALYPDQPVWKDVRRQGVFEEIFAKGSPSVVLCDNRTVQIERVGLAINQASRDAKVVKILDEAGGGARIATYHIDCSATIYGSTSGSSSSSTVYTKFGISRMLQPAFFAIGNGLRPVQLSPAVSYTAGDIAKALISNTGILRNKHTRIDHDRDLIACTNARSGGCLIVYTPREAKSLGNELSDIVQTYRTIQFAVLRAGQLQYKTVHTGLAGVLKDAVVEARTAASEVVEGGKGIVLLYTKKIPAALNGGDGESVLVSVWPCDGVEVTTEDVDNVVKNNRAAANILRRTSGGGGGSGSANKRGSDSGDDEEERDSGVEGEEGGRGGDTTRQADSIDAMLARDDDLLELQSAVVSSRNEVSIVRAPPKPTPIPTARPTPTPDPDARLAEAVRQSERRKADRERARAEEANNEGGGGGDDDDGDESEDSTASELERRRQMEEEESRSGHVAHAVDDESEDGGKRNNAQGEEEEQEEEIVDLDEEGEEGEEEL